MTTEEPPRGKGLLGDGSGDLAYLTDVFQPLLTVVIGMAAFIGCWIHAVNAWGWLLGLAFGWIPSGLLAAVAGYVTFKLWWVVGALIGLIVILIATGL